MTKKWDLETSNAETELKIRIYAKSWAKQVLLKIFLLWSKSTVNGQSQRSTVKVNDQSQRSTDDVCWHGSVTSPRAYVAGSEAQQVRGAREWAWDCSVGAREARGRYWRRVCCSFWPFLVGFCSGLSVLSFYAFFLAVECAEHLYPSVTATVGVMAVARFWQWRLDEGEGSGRTPKMSIGTRKSKEWLWYHVNNIKWERKTE